jgi:hypothetical protein
MSRLLLRCRGDVSGRFGVPTAPLLIDKLRGGATATISTPFSSKGNNKGNRPGRGSTTTDGKSKRRQDSKLDSAASSFRPRRAANYRAVQPGIARPIKDPTPHNDHKFVNLAGPSQMVLSESMKKRLQKFNLPDPTLDLQVGPYAADSIRMIRKNLEQRRNNPENYDDIEEQLRLADYFITEAGSTEEMVATRRALFQTTHNERERLDFLQNVDRLVDKGQEWTMGLESDHYNSFFPSLESGADAAEAAAAAAQAKLDEELFGDDDDTLQDDEDKDPNVRVLMFAMRFRHSPNILSHVFRN